MLRLLFLHQYEELRTDVLLGLFQQQNLVSNAVTSLKKERLSESTDLITTKLYVISMDYTQ